VAGRPDDDTKVVLLALGLASTVCIGMAGVRAIYASRLTYAFFCWNLVLAWVPLVLSLVLVRRRADGTKLGRLGTWSIGAVWLAFFPNAPYIVTDLIHLRARSPVPLWFDVIMVFAFALTGLCVAFTALFLVHGLVERRRGSLAGWLFVATVAGLTGFGVYLGRFQRWNSWDLVTRPGELLADAFGRILDPMSHPRTVGMTVLFGGFFAISYLMLYALTRLRWNAIALPAATEGASTRQSSAG
jgi:uncharacterized membrane protein